MCARGRRRLELTAERVTSDLNIHIRCSTTLAYVWLSRSSLSLCSSLLSPLVFSSSRYFLSSLLSLLSSSSFLPSVWCAVPPVYTRRAVFASMGWLADSPPWGLESPRSEIATSSSVSAESAESTDSAEAEASKSTESSEPAGAPGGCGVALSELGQLLPAALRVGVVIGSAVANKSLYCVQKPSNSSARCPCCWLVPDGAAAQRDVTGCPIWNPHH